MKTKAYRRSYVSTKNMDEKKRILQLIHRWKDEQLDFLIALCEQNSFTYNKKGTDKVSTIICEMLENVLPLHKVVHQEEVGDLHILKTQGSGKSVYLLGHTDTVFPPDHAFQECRREGDWLSGPGTADMKGGLAVIVYALKALQQAGVDKLPHLTLILGPDEEIGSALSRKIYERESKKAWFCVVGECAGQNGEIVVSRNGKAGGRMEISGKGAHVGSDSEDKSSAILELAHKVIAFESLNGTFPGIRVNVGQIEGGLGPSTIPAKATFLFDLRWQNEEHYTQILEKVQKIAKARNHPQCTSQITLLNYRPAMPPNEKTGSFLALLRLVAEDLGQFIPVEHRQGTSDGNFFGAQGVPTLDGFGPIGLNDHTPEERIRISTLNARTALMALFLLALLDTQSGL